MKSKIEIEEEIRALEVVCKSSKQMLLFEAQVRITALKWVLEPDYKKGYDILSRYFDSIADEEKQKVHEQLKKVGL